MTTSMTPTPEQLKQAQELWNLQGEVSFIRRVENFVYQTELDGRPVILRVTEPVHRTLAQIEAELDWMDFLAKKGMRLASPIRSASGKLVEKLSGENEYFVSVFEKAPGAAPKWPQEFSIEFMETWGRYLGKLHALTGNYIPSPGIKPRAHWNEDSIFQVVQRGLDEKDVVAYERFRELMEWTKTLPKDHGYGLVHCDLHYGNFFVHKGEITAFDFDDCCYHWLVYDLVTPLFHLWQKRDQGDILLPYEKIEEAYLQGYLAEHPLEKEWLNLMEPFIQLRISTVYHWAKASLADGLFAENENAQKWCENLFVWGRKQFELPLKLS